MTASLHNHTMASASAGFLAMLVALCCSYSIFFALATQLAVTFGVWIWLYAPLRFSKTFVKYPYAVGIWLLPLVYMLQLGATGLLLAAAEGSARKLWTHFDPKMGGLCVDLVYVFSVGVLIIHRITAGF